MSTTMTLREAMQSMTGTPLIIRVTNTADGKDYLLRHDTDGDFNQYYLHGPANCWWKSAHIDDSDYERAVCTEAS